MKKWVAVIVAAIGIILLGILLILLGILVYRKMKK